MAISRSWPCALVTPAGLAVFSLLVGCGGSSDDTKKQLKALETQITALRADADRLEERLEAVELSAAVSARASRSERPDPSERPRLKVIRLSPDDEVDEAPDTEAAPPAEAPGPDPGERRPVIRGKGDNVIKTGASVQWRRTGVAGKSRKETKDSVSVTSVPRLSPPFPGMAVTRRVSSEG